MDIRDFMLMCGMVYGGLTHPNILKELEGKGLTDQEIEGALVFFKALHASANRYGSATQDRLVETCVWIHCKGESYRKKRYEPEF